MGLSEQGAVRGHRLNPRLRCRSGSRRPVPAVWSEGHVRPPGSGTGVLSKPEAVVLLLRSFETVLDLLAYVASLVK